MIETDPLWIRLNQLELESIGGSVTFLSRLAGENGWSTSFTRRVIAEYRRFLFLAARAGHKVTPSTILDQAWHLHLLYTESYWNELCGEVLQRPLHHGPTKGGAAEDAKFESWYEKTLESYERVFGSKPPRDVWPRRGGKRVSKPRYRIVDTNRFFCIPRARVTVPARIGGLIALGLISAGSAHAGDGLIQASDLIGISVIVLVVVVILLVSHGKRNRSGQGDSSGSCSSGCGGGSFYSSDDAGSSGGDGGDGGDSGGGDGGSCGGGCGGCGGGGD